MRSLPRVEETDFILKNILLFSFSVWMIRCLAGALSDWGGSLKDL